MDTTYRTFGQTFTIEVKKINGKMLSLSRLQYQCFFQVLSVPVLFDETYSDEGLLFCNLCGTQHNTFDKAIDSKMFDLCIPKCGLLYFVDLNISSMKKKTELICSEAIA